LVTQNAKETQALGKEIGSRLKTENRKPKTDKAVVLALMGELGSGKTTFIQGLAKGLGIKRRIISPTFIILRQYVIRNTKNDTRISSHVSRLTNFYHIDLYRLETNIESEMKNLGMDEIMSDPSNLIAIEWAEKAKDYLPKNTQWIKFEHVSEKKRKIKININH